MILFCVLSLANVNEGHPSSSLLPMLYISQKFTTKNGKTLFLSSAFNYAKCKIFNCLPIYIEV